MCTLLSVSRYGHPVLFLLVLAACLPSESGGRTAQTGEAAADGPLIGFLEELDELVPPLLTSSRVPGTAVGIIHDGRIWATVGFGYADRENGIPVSDDHAFNIGSISKTVASWGVMKLVERGQLVLDNPVSSYLTRWQLPDSEFDHDGVTLRRLLSHTAGLSLSGYPGFHPGDPLPQLEESLSGTTNGSGGVYVAHEPGLRWQYSGGGYTLTQLIVEEITSQPFSEYMDAEVLGPLGMTSSSYLWNEEIDAIAATPYGVAGEAIGGPRFTAMAAAGLQTTLHDLTRFALASMGRLGGAGGTQGVLRWETVELMQTPVSAVPADSLTAILDPKPLWRASSVSYGLGYQLGKVGPVELASHGGVNEGWVALLYVAPELGDGIVIMTNGSQGIDVCLAITCRWLARVTGEECDPQS